MTITTVLHSRAAPSLKHLPIFQEHISLVIVHDPLVDSTVADPVSDAKAASMTPAGLSSAVGSPAPPPQANNSKASTTLPPSRLNVLPILLRFKAVFQKIKIDERIEQM